MPGSNLLMLFFVFFQIGLFSIGGGYASMPLIQQQVVEKYGWLTQQAFTDIITISQMTPGPVAVNTSTFVGTQLYGLPGAVAATAGCVISGILISVFLYRIFQKYRKSDYVSGILLGLKASSLGLILSAVVTILLLAFIGTSSFDLSAAQLNFPAVVVFAVSFFVIRKYKINPVLLMVLTGISGAFLYL